MKNIVQRTASFDYYVLKITLFDKCIFRLETPSILLLFYLTFKYR